MIKIETTVPLMGAVPVYFFNESKKVYTQFKNEIIAQNQIAHLGVASKAFTGINHTRLEYIYLQCAIIRFISRLHKGNDLLALSGKVKIPGLSYRISSGEELLKSWVLLHGVGHMNYTFGTERILLNMAHENKKFLEKLILPLPVGTKRWARAIITNYEYERIFKILAFIQIRSISNVRTRSLFSRMFQSVILPTSELSIDDSGEFEKLQRLRDEVSL